MLLSFEKPFFQEFELATIWSCEDLGGTKSSALEEKIVQAWCIFKPRYKVQIMQKNLEALLLNHVYKRTLISSILKR